jgi:hypothetical protein
VAQDPEDPGTPGDPGEADSTESESSGQRWVLGDSRSDEPKLVRLGPRYDPRRDREKTRAWLAKALVLLLAAVAMSLVAGTAAGLLNIEETKNLAVGVLSPLVAVTGTVFGFYYSGRSTNGNSPN